MRLALAERSLNRSKKITGGALAVMMLAAVFFTDLHPSPTPAPASAVQGGQMHTQPVVGELTPITAHGSLGGQLSGLLDFPEPLGDYGDYSLGGLTAPSGDHTGNGEVHQDLPAGDVEGVLLDGEDRSPKDEPGRGMSISGGSDRIERTPAGLFQSTEVLDFALDVDELNSRVGAVLGQDEVLRAEAIRTETTASVTGDIDIETRVEGLEVFGEQIQLDQGRLPEPVSRTHQVHSTNVRDVMRSLGVRESDISDYSSLVRRGSLEADFTMTVATPASGGLSIQAEMRLDAEVRLQLSLGSGDVWADDQVLDVVVAGVQNVAAPEPMELHDLALSAEEAEPGDEVTITGLGMAQGLTDVSLGGTQVQAETSSDGTSTTFTVPDGVPGGTYTVTVASAGDTRSAGALRVTGAETVPVRVTGLEPSQAFPDSEVRVSGQGFRANETTVVVTDADDETFTIPWYQVDVDGTGQNLTFRLPAGTASGAATVSVRIADQSDSSQLQVTPFSDPGLAPHNEDMELLGRVLNDYSIGITERNDSSNTLTRWNFPRLLDGWNNEGIGPSGTTRNAVYLADRQYPDLDAGGYGSDFINAAGNVRVELDREYDAHIGRGMSRDRIEIELDPYWQALFGSDPIVTVDSYEIEARANADGTTSEETTISAMQALGQTVQLQNGRIAQPQEFHLRVTRDQINNGHLWNGVIWADQQSGYSTMEGADTNYADLWVTVEPGRNNVSEGAVEASAFRVSADLQLRYRGDRNSVTVRQGSGGSESGERVTFFEAEYGYLNILAPEQQAPVITDISHTERSGGERVRLTGRGFTEDSTVLFGDRRLTPVERVSNGTELVFVVPEGAETGVPHDVAVETRNGTTEPSRSVTVYGTPVVVEDPESQTVSTSLPVEFTARGYGHPEASVQWQQRLEGGQWEDLEDETAERLVVEPQRELNGTQYRAVFSNSRGSTSTEPATLHYEFRPEFTTHPEDATLGEGETLQLSTAVEAQPEAEITWEVNRGGNWQSIEDAAGENLEYEVTWEDHGAQFRAVAENSHGSRHSDTANVAVTYAPQITRQPQDVVTEAGFPVLLSVSGRGNPVPQVQWQHVNGEEWEDLDGETATELTITPSREDNGTQYRAVLTNDEGRVLSEPAAVVVEYAPEFLRHPEDAEVAEGETAEFDVEIRSEPDAEIRWEILRDEEWVVVENVEGTHLSVEATRQEHGAQFRAVAENDLGEVASDPARLTVEVPAEEEPEPTEEPTPTEEPAPTEEPVPTEQPSTEPTQDPTTEPIPEPSEEPTSDPTSGPSEEPSQSPTDGPTTDPGQTPTAEPTETEQPSEQPSDEVTETASPTVEPTEEPTELDPTGSAPSDPGEPTEEPTESATAEPTDSSSPREEPTSTPTALTPEELEEIPGDRFAVDLDGRTVTVELGDQHAEQWVAAFAHSEPVFLGWHFTDSEGTFTVDIPDTLPAGEHRLAVLSADSEPIGWASMTLVEENGTPPFTTEPTTEPSPETTTEPTEGGDPTSEPSRAPTQSVETPTAEATQTESSAPSASQSPTSTPSTSTPPQSAGTTERPMAEDEDPHTEGLAATGAPPAGWLLLSLIALGAGGLALLGGHRASRGHRAHGGAR
ncbi:IPT/TIG domain-containing protein [Nesterenkonia alba]|uniref:IPT/TIG domain-containing protein n=1 Tax=Nesterenkonia alba TaxID=515814 RepID=UPI0003B5DDCC|nr:IPT/TIG domain-containing protein [Nesterenkonia alba]